MNSHRFLAGVFCLAFVVFGGCKQLQNLRSQSPDKNSTERDEFETFVTTRLVGDFTTIAGLNLVTLEGVGLIVGLDGTGGDPPPSMYRTALVENMKRREIPNHNHLLRSPNTALVVVRAYLPPMVRKGDRFDIEVRLPSNSEGTSLRGGRLYTTFLSERAIVPGRGVMKGHIFATARGPVLVSATGTDDERLAGNLRRGRILGGGRSNKDRDLSINLRNKHRGVRMCKMIAKQIGKRFFTYDQYGISQPLAKTTFSDQRIILTVPTRYKDNFPRYLQVVRGISMKDNPVARRVRMEQLAQAVNQPETVEDAAIKLEAIGIDALPILKQALRNPNFEVQFHAAMALAYLESPDGLAILTHAARNERAFRVFALAAIAAVDEPESHLVLRELTGQNPDKNEATSAELRYGAFRALWTLDQNDPFIRGKRMNNEFSLHLLNSDGEPMTHLTHRMRSEVVLFGANQRFHTPMAVKAGNHISVSASQGSNTITVSRYEVGQPDRRKEVSTRVADVIRTASEFGASYPDIVQLLLQAEKQYNLPGRLEIDAMPQAGRVYQRPGYSEGAEESGRKRRVGFKHLLPNMFGSVKRDSQTRDSNSNPAGTASLVDARTDKNVKDHRNWFLGKKLDFLNFRRK